LAQRTAIPFSLSATRSVAATLCSGSNCTVIISEGPITRWLVRIRPFWSTINPVPCPNSLQTITTESNIDEGACSPLIWPCTSPKSPKKNTKAACLLALYMACAANLVGVIAYSRIQVATHRSLYSLAFACTSDRELIGLWTGLVFKPMPVAKRTLLGTSTTKRSEEDAALPRYIPQ